MQTCMNFIHSEEHKKGHLEECIVHTLKVNGIQTEMYTIDFHCLFKKKQKTIKHILKDLWFLE